MKKIFLLCVLLCSLSLSSCAWFGSETTSLKGSIVGNTFICDTFDNSGNLTMTAKGEKIDVDSNIVNEMSYSSGSGWGYVQTLSSVINITIDGNQIITCGDTVIFYGTNIKPEYDFTVNNIDSKADGFSDNTIIAKTINDVKNAFGKPMVVVIKSQLGNPIYAFSGNNVYWEVADDLPKFTKLYIDGNPVYIHRANFQIIDKELL